MQTVCSNIVDLFGYSKTDKYITRMFINPDIEKIKLSTSSYHFSSSQILKEIESCYGKENLYWSMNTFKCPKRSNDTVYRLKHMFVDLDCQNTIYAQNPHYKQGIIETLQKEYFERRFPTPTFIVDSGRGLYLIWNIDEHKNAITRWKAVQQYLCDTLQEYGADHHCVDAARVLRIPGSINSKSKTEVKILECNDTKHNIYEFMEFYMPDELNTKKIAEKKKKKGKKEKTVKASFVYTDGVKRMLKNRLSDLETLLIKHRDKKHGLKEQIMFLYRMWSLQLYKDLNFVKSKIKILCDKLHHAQYENVLKETKSAEKYYLQNKVFFMTNDKIIDFLNITKEEMKDLKTIISKEESKKKKQEYGKKRYLEKIAAQGKQPKVKQIEKRRKEVSRLLKLGYNLSEISEILNVSRKTIQRDNAELKKESSAEIENAETVEITKVDNNGHKLRSIIMDVVLDTVQSLSELRLDVPVWISPPVHLRI